MISSSYKQLISEIIKQCTYLINFTNFVFTMIIFFAFLLNLCVIKKKLYKNSFSKMKLQQSQTNLFAKKKCFKYLRDYKFIKT